MGRAKRHPSASSTAIGRVSRLQYGAAPSTVACDSTKQQLLIDNIAGALSGVMRQEIVKRQIGHFLKADRNYGEGVAKSLGLTLDVTTAAA
jgi:catalase